MPLVLSRWFVESCRVGVKPTALSKGAQSVTSNPQANGRRTQGSTGSSREGRKKPSGVRHGASRCRSLFRLQTPTAPRSLAPGRSPSLLPWPCPRPRVQPSESVSQGRQAQGVPKSRDIPGGTPMSEPWGPVLVSALAHLVQTNSDAADRVPSGWLGHLDAYEPRQPASRLARPTRKHTIVSYAMAKLCVCLCAAM